MSPRRFLLTLDHGRISARWADSVGVAEYRDGEGVRVREDIITEADVEAVIAVLVRSGVHNYPKLAELTAREVLAVVLGSGKEGENV